MYIGGSDKNMMMLLTKIGEDGELLRVLINADLIDGIIENKNGTVNLIILEEDFGEFNICFNDLVLDITFRKNQEIFNKYDICPN